MDRKGYRLYPGEIVMVQSGGTADAIELRDVKSGKLLGKYYPTSAELEVKRGAYIARVRIPRPCQTSEQA